MFMVAHKVAVQLALSEGEILRFAQVQEVASFPEAALEPLRSVVGADKHHAAGAWMFRKNIIGKGRFANSGKLD